MKLQCQVGLALEFHPYGTRVPSRVGTQLLIKSIEVNGRILPVKLSAYDTDGQMGVYIPGSEEVSALKEMGADGYP